MLKFYVCFFFYRYYERTNYQPNEFDPLIHC